MRIKRRKDIEERKQKNQDMQINKRIKDREGQENAVGQARVKTNSPISSHGSKFIYMCVKLSQNGHVCYTMLVSKQMCKEM